MFAVGETRIKSMQPYDAIDGMRPEVVEREIASGATWLAFPEPIEALFVRDGQAARARTMIITALIGVFVYDSFLFLDCILLPDVFVTMIVARVGIFTPLALAMIVMAHTRPTRFRLDGFPVISGILACIIPIIVLMKSDSLFKLNYQYTNVLIMMFVAVVQRIRFRYAFVMLFFSVLSHLSIILSESIFDAGNNLEIAMFFFTVLINLSIASYILEYNDRKRFLFSLHATLLREQIAWAARTDTLTGLFNRRYLSDFFDAIRNSGPSRHVLAILLDIDHFKTFNDSRGHIQGDACLREVSACVAAIATRRDGVAFRYGGEEFLVILQEVDLVDGMQVAEEVRASIEAAAIPHPALGAGRVVTASLGIAGAMAPNVALSDLVAAADTALYAAKRSGRNRVLPGQPAGTATYRQDAGGPVAPKAVLC